MSSSKNQLPTNALLKKIKYQNHGYSERFKSQMFYVNSPQVSFNTRTFRDKYSSDTLLFSLAFTTHTFMHEQQA